MICNVLFSRTNRNFEDRSAPNLLASFHGSLVIIPEVVEVITLLSLSSSRSHIKFIDSAKKTIRLEPVFYKRDSFLNAGAAYGLSWLCAKSAVALRGPQSELKRTPEKTPCIHLAENSKLTFELLSSPLQSYERMGKRTFERLITATLLDIDVPSSWVIYTVPGSYNRSFFADFRVRFEASPLRLKRARRVKLRMILTPT